MPARIIKGLITYITAQTGFTCWDGEVPRYSTQDVAINPEALTTPVTWPIVKVFMNEGGFGREWTFEDPYSDEGQILIQVWGTSRDSVEDVLDALELLLASATNWKAIPLGGDVTNPNYVISMLLLSWYSGQEEGTRTATGELLYRGDLHYQCRIHGAVPTS